MFLCFGQKKKKQEERWQPKVSLQASPRLAQKLDDRRIKSSPNLTKIRRHDHKGLVNMSTEGIEESLHGLGGIEEIPSKIGVFSRTQQLQFGGGLVIPEGIALG